MSKESIVNEIAALFADTFKELKEATEAQESAIREVNRVKNKQYDSASAQNAALARANADLLEANERLSNAQHKKSSETAEKYRRLRAEFEKNVGAARAVNPAEVDAATVDLLKLGVLNGDDLVSLAEGYTREKNYTMLRVIGAEAERRFAESTEKKESSETRAVYARAISIVRESGPAKYHDSLDALDFIARRSSTDYTRMAVQQDVIEQALNSLRT